MIPDEDLNDFESDVLDSYGYEDDEPDLSEQEEVEAPEEAAAEEPADTVDDSVDDGEGVDDPDPVVQDNERVRSDTKGNLVAEDGRIVAKAGSERRLYEKAEKLKSSNAELESKYSQLEEEYKQHQGLMQQAYDEFQRMNAHIKHLEEGGVARDLGISKEESVEALQVYSKLKNDATALEGVKYILTRLQQRGINLESLGVPGGAIDMKVLTEDMNNRLNQTLQPFQQNLEQQRQQEQARNTARQQIDTFFAQNPDAREHRQVLGKAMQDPAFKGASLQEVWSMYKQHLNNEATKAAQAQRQQPAPEPRPSGYARPGAPQGPRSAVDDSPMHADLSYRDIMQSVRSDYGTID